MTTVKQSKSAWEKEYEDGQWEYLYGLGEAPRYALVANLLRRHEGPISLLDVGCGEGVMLRHLNLSCLRRYVGLDLAQTALDRISPKRPQDRYICSSLEQYSPDEKWDVIVFGEVLYYTHNPVEELRKFEASLNEGGFFVVSMHQKQRWFADGDRCTRQLKRYFKAHCTVLDDIELRRHANAQKTLTWEIFAVRPRNNPDVRSRPSLVLTPTESLRQRHP